MRLPDRTLLLVEVGSTAHGTGLDGVEDHDETAVVLETPRQLVWEPLGNRMDRTQPEGTRSGPGDVDRNVYSARKFLRLAAAGNPSILLAFWAPVLKSTDLGYTLRSLGPSLVGRHVIPRYRGYMRAQALRLLGLKGSGHGRRGGGKREELVAAHGYDTKYAMHAARLGFQCQELLVSRELRLPIEDDVRAWLLAVRRGEVPFEEWWDRVLQLDAQLGRWESNRLLPTGPDVDRVVRWLVNAHQIHSLGLPRTWPGSVL